ncbi:MAG: hypothetical protein R3211_06280 [Balneolaceae bacterium]|nr:hypothetical protein [Balneolaceae bacterium]
MRVFFLTSITVLLLLAGCSTTRNYYIEPEYQKSKIRSSVLVLPIQREWFEDNYMHTFGSLSGNQKTAFYSSLRHLFSEQINSELYAVDPSKNFPDSLFMSTTLSTGASQFEAMVPRKNVKLEFEGVMPRIVLVLDQYFYREKSELSGGSSYAGHEAEVKNFLYFETKYVYWDTEKGVPLAWGVSDAHIEMPAGESIGFQDYLAVLSKAVDKVAKQGPIL